MTKYKGSLMLVAVALVMSAPATAQQLTDSKFPLFATADAALHHCPFDSVVWLNTKTDTYSLGGPPANTPKEEGAYMCQRDADQMDYRITQEK